MGTNVSEEPDAYTLMTEDVANFSLIILMTGNVCTRETSISLYQTTRITHQQAVNSTVVSHSKEAPLFQGKLPTPSSG